MNNLAMELVGGDVQGENNAVNDDMHAFVLDDKICRVFYLTCTTWSGTKTGYKQHSLGTGCRVCHSPRFDIYLGRKYLIWLPMI